MGFAALRMIVSIATLAASAGLQLLPEPADAKVASLVVRTRQGMLRGLASGDVIEFRGVPYAAPPIGERRFEPPEGARTWSGVRRADRFAPTCVQGATGEEDCLYLNVTRPRGAYPSKLPVMVWLHGGGFSVGTPNTYDASELSARGRVIVVSVAFRLNAFGLMSLPGMSGAGSLLLQDQQAALQWVKRNIAAFGGDPRNVTLFGESGGAIGACGQMASPAARTLFHKAILQSGSCSTGFEADFVARGAPAGAYFMPFEETVRVSVDVARRLGCAPAAATAILRCLKRLNATAFAKEAGRFIGAAFGTPTLPLAPSTALGLGQGARIPVLTGFTHREGLAMVAGMQWAGQPMTEGEIPHVMSRAFGQRANMVSASYPLARYGGRGDLAWADVITDRMFACPQLFDAQAMAKTQPVFAYEFADPEGAGLIPMPPNLPAGASHSSDLPLLFKLADGPIDLKTGKTIARSPAQQGLSVRMIDAWSRFAWRGRPSGTGTGPAGWPRFDGRGDSVRWLAPDGFTRLSPGALDAHHCGLWRAIMGAGGPSAPWVRVDAR